MDSQTDDRTAKESRVGLTDLLCGSLFSGIGGLDLGLERAGMNVIWQVERDEYCRRVLERHWPNVRRWDDVRAWPQPDTRPVDVLCGGFPCQDISDAGPRIGIDGERSGLWAEFARIIREVRPSIVVVENVSALLDRGIGRVLGDLAAMGFDAEWGVVSSCAVGAAHMRERLFVVANATRWGSRQLRWEQCPQEGEADGDVHRAKGEPGIPRELDGVSDRLERCRGIGNAVDPRVGELIGRRIMAAMVSA